MSISLKSSNNRIKATKRTRFFFALGLLLNLIAKGERPHIRSWLCALYSLQLFLLLSVVRIVSKLVSEQEENELRMQKQKEMQLSLSLETHFL